MLHGVDEWLEEDVGVVRAGRGLRVELHGEDRQRPVPEAFERFVKSPSRPGGPGRLLVYGGRFALNPNLG